MFTQCQNGCVQIELPLTPGPTVKDLDFMVQKLFDFPFYNQHGASFEISCPEYKGAPITNDSVLYDFVKKPMIFIHSKQWFHLEDLQYYNHNDNYLTLLFREVKTH